MRTLIVVLLAQLALGAGVIGLALSGNLPFAGDDTAEPRAAQADSGAPCTSGRAPRARARGFDGRRALGLVRRQLALGPRPAGSAASRRLAEQARRALPGGRFQAVPGGLRNVIGSVRGRERGRIVVGAHYDTKDMPGFLGANDGASGTAVLLELARSLERRPPRRSVTFVLFDGEESPRGTPDEEFQERGLRGSKVAAPRLKDARAMVLLDFVGDRRLSIPREGGSDDELWARLRSAATAVGVGCVFPDDVSGSILDDHVPFIEQGVPAIDLIDFEFDCFHRRCDDMSAISERSLDAVGEATLRLVARL